jgi:NADH-quinone oxidoreductase subunit A
VEPLSGAPGRLWALGKISRGMEGSYLGIGVLVVVAAILCAAMVTLSWLLGPKKSTPYKASPYECGVAPVGSARERFPIKFYLVAILFVLFDIEVVFLWGWMTVFRDADNAFKLFSFIEVLVYMSTWILGYVYAIRVNAIDWDETVTLEEAKLGRGGLEPAGGGQ